MSLDASDFEQFRITFQKITSDVENVSKEEMAAAAEELLALAKLQAPVDEGNLEDAIKLRATGGGFRNAKGQFVKGGGAVIYVDNNMPAVEHDTGKPIMRDGAQVKVGDYAWWVHENVEPAGPAHLGKKSQLKQQALGGAVEVGGWYMTRAAEKIRISVNAKIGSAIAKTIKAMDI